VCAGCVAHHAHRTAHARTQWHEHSVVRLTLDELRALAAEHGLQLGQVKRTPPTAYRNQVGGLMSANDGI
jgi:hypothetical protein